MTNKLPEEGKRFFIKKGGNPWMVDKYDETHAQIRNTYTGKTNIVTKEELKKKIIKQ